MDSVEAMNRFGRDVLHSERLRLRPIEEPELAVLERWWNDPETLGLQSSTVLPRPAGGRIETFRQWHTNASATDVGFGVERISDGALIGSVVLFGAIHLRPSATFAIILDPDAAGQGYGTEATRLMVDYGFRALPLRRIQLEVWAFNTRARATYRRAGFVEEGMRRQVVFFDGAWHDEVLMAVLREDWAASRQGE